MSSENHIQELKTESMQIHQKHPCNLSMTKQTNKKMGICDVEQLKTITKESR